MDVLAKTKELLGSLADVTESGSLIARYKIEVANLDRKLGVQLRKVGERAWQLQTEGRTDVLGDAEVQSSFEEVRRLRARMEVIRQDVERNRARAVDEVRRAARIVKTEAGRAAATVRQEAGRAATTVRKEAGRAAETVRVESGRAVAAVKKAVAGKSASRKKPGNETTDLQP